MEGSCSVEGCHRPAYARGWCRSHYNRWAYSGDPGGARVERASSGLRVHHQPGAGPERTAQLQAEYEAGTLADRLPAFIDVFSRALAERWAEGYYDRRAS